MVKVFQGTDHEYYLDGYLKENLDVVKTILPKDWDFVFIVDGYEGSGKSVVAQQVAFYLDPSLTVDRITFTPDEFKSAVLKAKEYQSVIFDEGFTGLSSRSTMSHINKSIKEMLSEIRQKRLIIGIVMPSFFDLDKYVALWRGRALIHVYTNPNKAFQRGFLAFYNVDKKKSLYVNGKKFYSYSNPSPNFRGRFTNTYPVDEVAYRQKKRDSLFNKGKESKEIRVPEMEEEILKRCIDVGILMPLKYKLMMMGGIHQTTYNRKKKKLLDMIAKSKNLP